MQFVRDISCVLCILELVKFSFQILRISWAVTVILETISCFNLTDYNQNEKGCCIINRVCVSDRFKWTLLCISTFEQEWAHLWLPGGSPWQHFSLSKWCLLLLDSAPHPRSLQQAVSQRSHILHHQGRQQHLAASATKRERSRRERTLPGQDQVTSTRFAEQHSGQNESTADFKSFSWIQLFSVYWTFTSSQP